MDSITSVLPVPQSAEGSVQPPAGYAAIPPLRWIMVGYFFWVGIFLGALIMHAATSY